MVNMKKLLKPTFFLRFYLSAESKQPEMVYSMDYSPRERKNFLLRFFGEWVDDADPTTEQKGEVMDYIDWLVIELRPPDLYLLGTGECVDLVYEKEQDKEGTLYDQFQEMGRKLDEVIDRLERLEKRKREPEPEQSPIKRVRMLYCEDEDEDMLSDERKVVENPWRSPFDFVLPREYEYCFNRDEEAPEIHSWMN